MKWFFPLQFLVVVSAEGKDISEYIIAMVWSQHSLHLATGYAMSDIPVSNFRHIRMMER